MKIAAESIISPEKSTTKMHKYLRLMRLDKPIGTQLLLYPTLWALWFAAKGIPPFSILGIFVIGTFLMRSAGCVLNDLADRNFDGKVNRTKNRPLATGEVSAKEALLLFFALIAAAFLLIVPILSTLFLTLCLIAVFLTATYPFTKRFFAIPQAYLGVAFGFGIPLAFAAITQNLPPEAFLLLAANIFWAIAYDTEYAMVDREDDLKIGIKTSAITFGKFDVIIVMASYAATLLILILLGGLSERGAFFYGGIFIAFCIAIYHFGLIKNRQPEKCFAAFRHNNWFGAALFVGIFLDFHLA